MVLRWWWNPDAISQSVFQEKQPVYWANNKMKQKTLSIVVCRRSFLQNVQKFKQKSNLCRGTWGALRRKNNCEDKRKSNECFMKAESNEALPHRRRNNQTRRSRCKSRKNPVGDDGPQLHLCPAITWSTTFPGGHKKKQHRIENPWSNIRPDLYYLITCHTIIKTVILNIFWFSKLQISDRIVYVVN